MWDKLKGLVMEDEPGDAKPAAQSPSPQAAKPSVGSTPTPGGINQAMVDAIRKSTFSRNTALTNLIQQADGFIDIIPDQTMRLKAAHKASGNRSTKEIIDAIAIHLSDVDGEEMRFGQALAANITDQVGGLQQRAAILESQTSAKNTEIQQLTQRISLLQQEISQTAEAAAAARADATAKESELRQAESDFKAAANAVRAELNGQKATIQSTLG